MTVTCAAILDTRRKKKDNIYPVKLRVTYRRKRVYYKLGYDLCQDDWDKINTTHTRGQKLREIKKELNAQIDRAYDIIDELKEFSFMQFKRRYFRIAGDYQNVYVIYKIYIEDLRNQERLSSAENYQASMKSIQKFARNLEFVDVTVDFLKRYESFMTARGTSLTTVGIYLRAFRTIVNLAIDEYGVMSRNSYPFGKRAYQIPTGRNTKRALNAEGLKKIFNYQPEPGSWDEKALDFWKLSYLSNGANMKDILHWKFQDIEDNKISFYRAKTRLSTKNNPKLIVVIITPEIREIIEKYKNPREYNSNYLFPELSHHMTAQRRHELLKQFIKNINTHMKAIAKELELDISLTTYVARHSFSTILKRSGAPTEFIQESLGHHNKSTTENYLDAFEDEVKIEFAKRLTEFV